MNKRILSTALVIALMLTLIPLSTAQAGSAPEALGITRTSLTDGATYTISTEGELARLAYIVNNGENCEGNFFVLTSDIVINSDHDSTSDGNWTPIGYGNSRSFSGSFYGQNHTISGLDIRAQTYLNVGFFGTIGADGVVLDLHLSGSMTRWTSMGGVAGENRGTIMNCSSGMAYVPGTDASYYVYSIGGIAGFNTGVIQNCLNTASIDGSFANDRSIGGIVGICNDGGRVINCRNTGNLSGYDNIGGIVGVDQGSKAQIIRNCYNTGNISGNNAIGGIVGALRDTSQLSNCYSTGVITTSVSESAGAVAGFIGTGTTADNCYWFDETFSAGYGTNSGTVTNLVSFTGTDTLSSAVGGTTSLLTALNNYVASHSTYNMRSWVDGSTVPPLLTGITVVKPPKDAYALVGGTADFTVLAAGDALTYQWQVLSTAAGASWTNVTDGTGATTPTYTIPAMTAAMESYKYRCVLSGSVNSAPATLRVATLPVITKQPVDCYVAVGEEGELSISASGVPLTYLWYASMDGGSSWGPMSTDSTIPFTMEAEIDGWLFYCKVSTPAGSVDSDIVGIYLPVAASITTGPQNLTVAQGNTATFTVTAAGKPSPTYQWQLSADGTAWANVTDGTGGTTVSYTTKATTPGMNGYSYRCVVTNKTGSATSAAAKLTVLFLTADSSSTKIFTGGRITITPSIEGGTWTFDESYLTRSGNTFTALKTGTVRVTYTVGGESRFIDVTITNAELPNTGQNFNLFYVFTGLALVLLMYAIITRKAVRKSE